MTDRSSTSIAMKIRRAAVEHVALSRLARTHLTVETPGAGFIDLTPALRDTLRDMEAEDGLVTLFVKHTSASLTIQENADPDVLRDLTDALDGLAPRDASYRHSMEGLDDMPAHIRTMLSDVSLTIPVTSGRPDLGTWQAVYLIEHRDRPHRRQVIVSYFGA